LALFLMMGPLALFDVRGDTAYESCHIPGAMTAPLGSLVFRVARVMNPDSTVVVYSEGRKDGLAAQAAQRLEDLGLSDVRHYEEGLEGWKRAGLPLTSIGMRAHLQGPVRDCRPILVDREQAYGGAFKGTSDAVEGAGG